jgi:glycosyltransferase involved in cell wall biosynthesis
MKIMLVLNEAPLPYAGAAARWYYILCKELINRNIILDLFVSCSTEEQKRNVLELFPRANVYLYEKRVKFIDRLSSILKPFSYTISKEMRLAISEKFYDNYDIIHVEQSFATWALPEVDRRCMLSVHYLSNIDLKDVKMNSLKDYFIVPLMKRTEKKMIGKYQNIKSCSLNIEKTIQDWFPDKNYIHFPFAIDVTEYKYLEKKDRLPSGYITLIASMGWYPGRSAAENLITKIWPSLKKLNPQMKLRIVGWSARSVLKKYLQLPDIEILENVPEIKKYFYETSLLVYTPDAGSGIKIKIQESMLLGTPVVTNFSGVEGLMLEDQNEVLVAHNDDHAVQLIHRLYNDIELQEKIRFNARLNIEKTCNSHLIMNQLLNFYQQIKNQ